VRPCEFLEPVTSTSNNIFYFEPPSRRLAPHAALADFYLADGDWTVEFWQKNASTANGNRTFLSQGDTSSPNNSSFVFTEVYLGIGNQHEYQASTFTVESGLAPTQSPLVNAL
jgi:hypothetical protein